MCFLFIKTVDHTDAASSLAEIEALARATETYFACEMRPIKPKWGEFQNSNSNKAELG